MTMPGKTQITLMGTRGAEPGSSRLWRPQGGTKRVKVDDAEDKGDKDTSVPGMFNPEDIYRTCSADWVPVEKDQIKNRSFERHRDQAACSKKEKVWSWMAVFMGLYLCDCSHYSKDLWGL
ncbi:hypothetical protein NDU88_004062 [Pleurodeles waltl]|uniref:Uncharacterized protein n=1 Tax=Pleurodeles waltl TaxID=8319 RepID=A0AAV7KXB2_PLEWA|nr:hypothetical protein NDU88_004062 [Pleurodeles waltl]